VEPEVRELMADSLDKNMIDSADARCSCYYWA
jgi:hypothetical protein